MPSDHTRRRFLQAAGSATVLALAGCAGGDNGDTETDSPTPTETPMETTAQSPTDTGMGGTTAGSDMGGMEPVDPGSAPRVTVDRFSEDAGTLMVRSDGNGLPGPGEPVDFDSGAPFLTDGLGPEGGTVTYYNFDVQPTAPAPIYVLFREGEDAPVEKQLNVVDAVPGDDGYNDFWQVHKVTVPGDYTANTVTSLADVTDRGYSITPMPKLVNCPVVPEGSTASMRLGDGTAGLVEGWYRGQVVSYFEFTEAPLSATDSDQVPLSPIWVAFNTNPGNEGGGPASGFMTESGTSQTHNVVATVPGDEGYSPLWFVNVYDNADFGSVSDLDSAKSANQLAAGAAMVNCPIVGMEGA